MTLETTQAVQEVWHPGEVALQASVGMVQHMALIGKRVVRDYMPDQHRDFFAQLPFIVLGSVDPAGDAWATILDGQPGFLSSPAPTMLDIGAQADPTDPAEAGLRDGSAVGLLGIEMHSRRRNRMNGVLAPIAQGYRVTVAQSFGNCPRYIQLRDFAFDHDPALPFAGAAEDSATLDGDARLLIEGADTFFVASYADSDGGRQVDVSHRGGQAGFVRVGDDGVLTIPDFDGNLFFSTLGNIVLNGKAGLLFVDYASGDMLHLTGNAAVDLESPEIGAFRGAERLWTFRPRRIVRRRGALALRWRFQADPWSPSSLMTGDWTQAADRLRAAELAKQWRPFRITKIVEESRAIKSFHLTPDDGVGKAAHLAGQHLPIRLALPGSDRKALRTYTLSVAPSDGDYRISVKRDGAVSSHLHDHMAVGDIIEARAPAGDFTIDARETRPAVLVAGGVGITPMLAMLRHIVQDGIRRQSIRPTILFHSARSKAERPFDREIADLANAAMGAVRVVRLLSDTAGAEQDVDYDIAGRIDATLLRRFLPDEAPDYYLCGPPAFTQSLYDQLRDAGVPDARIHAEAFGPSSLVRRMAERDGPQRPDPSTVSVPILFTQTGKEARWEPGSGTLLELAEARGLEPDYSCRGGSCGTCRTRLIAGAVTYVKEPTAQVADDEVLICCAVPAEPVDGQSVQLNL